MLGMTLGGIWNWTVPVVIFIVSPVLEAIVGRRDTPKASEIKLHFFDAYILLAAPFLTLFLGFSLFHYLHSEGWEAVGILLSSGIVMGFMGLTIVHELMHRKQKLHRWAAYSMLWLVNYGHWGVEHVHGHHKNIATLKDAVTARKNEWLYAFWFRAITQSFLKSLKHDRSKKWWKNRIYFSLAAQTAITATVFALFGWDGLVFHLGQSLTAIVLLESVEYIQHYGLLRKQRPDGSYEPTQQHHAWDCDYYLTNITLINLGYHSFHHRNPFVKYEDLQAQKGTCLMPYGYSGMILMATVPPLFFKVMNPKLPVAAEPEKQKFEPLELRLIS